VALDLESEGLALHPLPLGLRGEERLRSEQLSEATRFNPDPAPVLSHEFIIIFSLRGPNPEH